jgi:serine palmitoyltransferase
MNTRPIASSPGAHIEVMERKSIDQNFSLKTTGKTKTCLNLGSYNYLGFADDWQETCKKNVLESLEKYEFTHLKKSYFNYHSYIYFFIF